ncbi:MAG: alkylation response protein AidB-like acyl-CoA dehydrogenase [Candidatus Poriferisodalaceae bacterium]|jgi:alkylation response protein AidB-like acyl-CoA dehydrogenase
MSETLTEAEVEEFRTKVRTFLEANAVPAADYAAQTAFQGALAEAGLAGSVFANEYGGAGLSKAHDRIIREEQAKVPAMNNDYIISHGMCLPVLNDFGTEQQKKKFMPDNIAGRTLWCQMFSEPGAGSDVSSLQTKAERDGDEWIINGQKVWTTLAHVSDYAVLIARTNPEAVKHAGISMFILPMDAPGVEVRPIHQIDGGSHFNEVFFTDARIPAENLLGELNNGWNQATAMLMYERVAIGTIGGGKISQPNYKVLVAAAEAGNCLDDLNVRQDLARVYSMETAKSLMAMRTRAEQQAGKTPGPGGSLGKLFGSNVKWLMRDILMNMAGPASQAWSSDNESGGLLAKETVGSFSSSIAGGTDEIQRNIIGDRVLGLPRDISVDRGVPFKDLKTS